MLGILKLPSHMDGFLHPLGIIFYFNESRIFSFMLVFLGNSGVYSYVSKPKTVVDTYLKGEKFFSAYLHRKVERESVFLQNHENFDTIAAIVTYQSEE